MEGWTVAAALVSVDSTLIECQRPYLRIYLTQHYESLFPH